MNEDRWYFVDKVTGFIFGALRLNYSYEEAYDLLLKSKEGRYILDRNETYFKNLRGMASAIKADNQLGKNYKKNSKVYANNEQIQLLVELIYDVNDKYNIAFEDIFQKTKIDKVVNLLGDEVDKEKFIKTYIIKE